jgi:hypothetical protein
VHHGHGHILHMHWEQDVLGLNVVACAAQFCYSSATELLR